MGILDDGVLEIEHGKTDKYYKCILDRRQPQSALPAVLDDDGGDEVLALENDGPVGGGGDVPAHGLAEHENIEDEDSDSNCDSDGSLAAWFDSPRGSSGERATDDGGDCGGEDSVSGDHRTPCTPRPADLAPSLPPPCTPRSANPTPTSPPRAKASCTPPAMPAPHDRSPSPAAVASSLGAPAPSKTVNEFTTEWGPYRLTWVKPKPGAHQFGAWQGLCRFHRMRTVKCTKRVSVSGPTDAEKEDALNMAKHWCVHSILFTRKKDHGQWNPRLFETPPPEVLEAEMLARPAVPAYVKTDEELNAEEGLAPAGEGDDSKGDDSTSNVGDSKGDESKGDDSKGDDSDSDSSDSKGDAPPAAAPPAAAPPEPAAAPVPTDSDDSSSSSSSSSSS